MFDLEYVKNPNKKRKVENVTKENDLTFLKDGMTTSEIRKTVLYIREYIEKGGNTSLQDKITKLKIDYKIFFERYPLLFEMCTRQEFDFNILNYFLQMRENIINNQISNEDASKQIGKEWFDKYVDVSKLEKKN